MASYKQIKEFQAAKGEQLQKNTILIPDWLTWMFHYVDFWTLVSMEVTFIFLRLIHAIRYIKALHSPSVHFDLLLELSSNAMTAMGPLVRF